MFCDLEMINVWEIFAWMMCCLLTGTHISQSRKEEIILWNLALHAHRIRTFYWSRMRGSTQNWHSQNNNLFPLSYLVEHTKMKNRFYFASKSFQQWNKKCFVNHTQLPALNIVAFTFSPGFFWIIYLYIFSLLSQPIRHFRPKNGDAFMRRWKLASGSSRIHL